VTLSGLMDSGSVILPLNSSSGSSLHVQWGMGQGLVHLTPLFWYTDAGVSGCHICSVRVRWKVQSIFYEDTSTKRWIIVHKPLIATAQLYCLTWDASRLLTALYSIIWCPLLKVFSLYIHWLILAPAALATNSFSSSF